MFISRDPIGLLGGYNVFAYAPNPIGWVDPWGLRKTRNQRLGDFGENIAKQNLESTGKYKSVFPVQNASNNGIDLVGERHDGKFDMFEVKTTTGNEALDLSKRQKNPMTFIGDILSDGKAGSGSYGIDTDLAEKIRKNIGDKFVIDVSVGIGNKSRWYIKEIKFSKWIKGGRKCL